MDDAELMLELNSNYSLSAISFAILFYDYFLTLQSEIERYWPRARHRWSWNWASILYFANRYGTLLGNVPVVVHYLWSAEPTAHKEQVSDPSHCHCGFCLLTHRTQICHLLESYHEYYIVGSQVIVGTMLLLRTYALYGQNRCVLGFLLLVGAAVVVCGVYGTVFLGSPGSHEANIPLEFGCDYPINRKQANGAMFAWAAMGVFDVVIFLLTVFRAIRMRARGDHMCLLTLLLRDADGAALAGSIYFGVMVLLNLSNLLTYVYAQKYTRGVATTFMNIMSSVMISRLMLNIRDPALSSPILGHSDTPCDTTEITRGAMLSTVLSAEESEGTGSV
ncbi:unnamed protein product [Mycena citricolor]|uniref:DUF6533 domain-containing protein n=1 Tax=Mycena citricolor TaxID=2018698 RepID=A0AAD2K6Y8_9AGAR|nr:unnamed protein product [Mycena citricolor]